MIYKNNVLYWIRGYPCKYTSGYSDQNHKNTHALFAPDNLRIHV